MKVAVIGPIAKDTKIIDDKKIVEIGGIPFYIGRTLKSLGVDVTAFIAHDKEDDNFVEKNFPNIKVNHIHSEGTLTITHEFSSDNSDFREVSVKYFKNIITLKDVGNLEKYDWISLGPLFNEDMDEEFFKSLPERKIIFNNFGFINYAEKGKFSYKYPERFIKVLKYFEWTIIDEEELKFVTKMDSVEESVRFLRTKGLKNAVITKGTEGSVMFFGDQVYNIPAFKIKHFVDTTGCGDTYVAGLIKAMELFDDPQKQGEFAAMVATMRIENKSPFSKSTEDVLERLNFDRQV